MFRENPTAFGPTIADELERAEKLTIEDIGWAEKQRTQILAGAQEFFEAHDLLITPAASVPPFPHAEQYPHEIEGEDMGGYLRWEAIAYDVTLLANPAAVIPCGSGPGGLPMGLQLVGPLRRDAWILDFAHYLEALFAESPELKRPLPDISRLAHH